MSSYNKEKLLNEEMNYNAYSIIKNNFKIDEIITISKIINMLENKGIICNRYEAKKIINNAQKYAWNSDKFEIQEINSGSKLSYKICSHKFN